MKEEWKQKVPLVQKDGLDDDDDEIVSVVVDDDECSAHRDWDMRAWTNCKRWSKRESRISSECVRYELGLADVMEKMVKAGP